MAETETGTGFAAAWQSAPGPTLVLATAVPLGALAVLALPAVVAQVVDAVLGRGDTTGPVLLLACALLLSLACGVATEIAGPGLGATLTAGLRHRMCAHLVDLGTDSRNTLPSGDVTSRVVGAAPDAAGTVPAVLSSLGALVTSVGGVIALAFVHPYLALAFLCGIIPGIIVIRLFMRQATDWFTRYQEVQAKISARLTDALSGARTIRASGTRDREIARVLQPLPELNAAGHGLWNTQRHAVTKLLLLVPAVELAVLAVAGHLLNRGDIPPGGMIAAAGYAALGLGFLEQLESLVGIARAKAGAQRAAGLLGQPAAPHGNRRVLPPGPGEVVFRKVTVRIGDRTVLDNLDLTVPGGSSLAIVGVSGSGKSTLAALPGRLRDPDSGEVLVDGQPVARQAPGELRRAIAYAFPRPHLHGTTLYDALAYGRPGARSAEVTRAAHAAHADTFIRRLPEGYATALDALRLSGGELQRLGLARALVQDSRVLILDDATSSLDTVTEHQVLDAFTRGSGGGPTRIMVAHRAGVAAQADRVAWLDHGRIRAIGRHSELWTDPAYRAVFGVTETKEKNH